MASGNKYHHGDLRSELLKIATDKLKAEGIDSITMRGLSADLGVSRTAPYRHFKDKDELLCAIAKEGFRLFGNVMGSTWERNSTLPAKDRFCAVGETYIDFCCDYPEYYQLMFSNTGLLKNPNQELRSESDSTFDFLRSKLQFCQDEGVFKLENTQQQASFVWCALHGFCSILTANSDVKATRMLDERHYFLNKIVDGLSC